MPEFERITSFQNSRIKLAKQLQDKKHREREGLFIADYGRDIARALDHDFEVEFTLACPTLLNDEEQQLLPRLKNVYEVSEDLLEKAGYRQNPSGLLTVFQSKSAKTLQDALESKPQRVLALVGLEKPGNIGALLRSADATGFDAIFLIDIALDLYNPNIIRASTGACFLGNLYVLNTTSALQFFKAQTYAIIAAHLNGQHSLFDLSFVQPYAIVLGTEDKGLDTRWEKECTHLVKIPMVGQLSDSLNVSVSGAIFMYEALRQRLTNN
jgi:RNA methyltransferase, TrmH family